MGVRTSKDASENQHKKGEGATIPESEYSTIPESVDSQLTSEDPTIPEPNSSKATGKKAEKGGVLPKISRQERRRISKGAPLSVANVMTALLLHKYNEKWRWFGRIMYLPETVLDTIMEEYSSGVDCLREVVQYWLLKDPYASWRRLITQLYQNQEFDFADSLLLNAEKCPDSDNAIRDLVAQLLEYAASIEYVLNIHPSTVARFKLNKRHELVRFWISTSPYASCEGVAGFMYNMEMRARRSVENDASLTVKNVTSVLVKVNNIPKVAGYLHLDSCIHNDYEGNARLWLEHHPAPSWQYLANALYLAKESEALEFLKSEYYKGSAVSRQKFREAMKRGHISSQISKILLYGAAGTGKSSFMDLILGNPPSEVRRSTPLAVRPVTVFHVDVTQKEWLMLSSVDRKRIIARAMMSIQIKEEEEEKEREEEVIFTSICLKRCNSEPGLHAIDLSSPSPSMEALSSSPVSPTELEPHTTPQLSDNVSTDSDLVGLIDQCSTSDEAMTAFHKLHLIDSGGQPQFHEVLPIFLRHMTLYIFVFKLSEELASKPTVEYFNESGKRLGAPYPSAQTNEQLLKHCLRTLHSHKLSSGEGRSRIVIVGTHRDKEKSCRLESRLEKNKKLGKLLIPAFEEEVVYYNLMRKEFIFPVNAKNPDDSDKALAKSVQKIVLDEVSPTPIDVPLQYYALEILLEELSEAKHRGVLSREECLRAVQKFHVAEEDTLDVALEFLDEISVIFYFPEVLSGVVFTNPQILLDKVTELVEAIHRLQGTTVCAGYWRKFKDHALFTLAFLDQSQFQKHYVSGIFTSTELVKLFKKLFIFAKFSDSEYLMPALLAVVDDSEVERYRVPHDSPIAPITLEFSLGGPRLGTYCALTCFLVSSENRHPAPWKIKLQPRSVLPACLCRNCIQFSVPRHAGIVTLIDTFTHFEVHITVPASAVSQAAGFCSFVRQAISAGLQKVLLTLGYTNVQFSLELLCPCGMGDPHSASFGEGGIWVCSSDECVCEQLQANQTLWLEQEKRHQDTFSADTCQLNLRNARIAAWDARSRWYDMGVELCLDTPTLNAIRENFQGAVEDCFREVLDRWLKDTLPRPSWEMLAAALEASAVGYPQLAKQIRQKQQ